MVHRCARRQPSRTHYSTLRSFSEGQSPPHTTKSPNDKSLTRQITESCVLKHSGISVNSSIILQAQWSMRVWVWMFDVTRNYENEVSGYNYHKGCSLVRLLSFDAGKPSYWFARHRSSSWSTRLSNQEQPMVMADFPHGNVQPIYKLLEIATLLRIIIAGSNILIAPWRRGLLYAKTV